MVRVRVRLCRVEVLKSVSSLGLVAMVGLLEIVGVRICFTIYASGWHDNAVSRVIWKHLSL